MRYRAAPPLVLTKLQPPVATQEIITRRSLDDFGERVLKHRLALVCAAAGYGKTTLLGTLYAQPWPVAWYSLGKSDSDPAVFLYCLREGLKLALKHRAQPLLKDIPQGTRTRDDVAAHLAHLVNGLSEIPCDHIIIALDDFHLVEKSKSLVWFVNQLIATIPVNTHLVLSSRTNVSIPSVPKLRVSGQVLDVREYDLRFDSDEALQLLEKGHHVTLPRPQIDALVEQMEGWPIGLHLAAQSLSQRTARDAEDFLSRLSSLGQPLFDYLAEEVFSQQPRSVQEFMLRSSILTQMDEDTCNAILKRDDSGQMLRRILRSNVFLSSLDGALFRYHQLFRDFLRHRLSQNQQEFLRMHAAAADHFASIGHEDQAIYHFLAAKQFRRAGELISAASDRLLRTSRFDTLAFWIQELPSAVVDEFPELLFRRAEIDHIRGRYDSSLQWYDRAARVCRARGDAIGVSRVLERKGRILTWRVGEPQNAERLHKEALAYLGEENKLERAALLADLARDRMSAGELNLGFELYHQAIQLYDDLGDTGREGKLATLINPGAWLYFDRGDFCRSIALLQQAASLAVELDCKHQLAECYNTMSSHLFMWGKVEESRICAEKALELSRRLASDFGQGVALMNLANIIEDEGDERSEEYLKWHRRALDIFETAGNRRFCIATLNFMSAACRHRGLAIEAAKYAQQALILARGGTAPWLIAWSASNLGAAKIDSNVTQALDLLEEAMDTFSNYEDKHNLTQVHLWFAAALRKTEDPAWIDHLHICLQLARDGGYECTLRREKRISLTLLIEALKEEVEIDYVSALLPSFGDAALNHLVTLLENPKHTVRLAAMAVLSKIDSGCGWKALLRCARHPDPSIRAAANSSLAITRIPEPPPLDIYCLGPFQVNLGVTPIADEEWKRRKVKSLLKYIASSRDMCASKDEIIDVFWPDIDPDAANNNFYRTLHHLRRLLDENAASDNANYVLFEGGMVRLSAELVARIDTEDFERLAREGRRIASAGNHDLALLSLEAAVQLYRGDFLADDPYEDWTQPKREHLREVYFSTLTRLSDLHAQRRNWDAACEYLRRILALDNTREDIHLRLISCLASSGNHSEAIKQYQRCERALKEELETEPAPETKAFFSKIVRQTGTV